MNSKQEIIDNINKRFGANIPEKYNLEHIHVTSIKFLELIFIALQLKIDTQFTEEWLQPVVRTKFFGLMKRKQIDIDRVTEWINHNFYRPLNEVIINMFGVDHKFPAANVTFILKSKIYQGILNHILNQDLDLITPWDVMNILINPQTDTSLIAAVQFPYRTLSIQLQYDLTQNIVTQNIITQNIVTQNIIAQNIIAQNVYNLNLDQFMGLLAPRSINIYFHMFDLLVSLASFESRLFKYHGKADEHLEKYVLTISPGEQYAFTNLDFLQGFLTYYEILGLKLHFTSLIHYPEGQKLTF
ncbi:Hypothetical protein HVR_LOCUS97 [uncultured virus]|nr:Hypothetical protein HVR_LOCUS97 [uncultured virus]